MGPYLPILFWKSLLIIIILVQITSGSDETTIKSFASRRSFQKKKLIISESSVKNATFSYALCSITEITQKKDCEIVLESILGDVNFKDTCDITLYTSSYNREIDLDQIQVTLLSSNMVILTWADLPSEKFPREAVYLQIQTIVFPECEIYETKVGIDRTANVLESVNILPYEQTFDLFYPHLSDCNDKTLCRIYFSFNGTRIIGPVSSIPRYYSTIRVKTDSSRSYGNDYVTVMTSRDFMELAVSNLRGNYKRLYLYQLSEGLEKVGYDVSNDRIGICFQKNEKLLLCKSFNSTNYQIWESSYTFPTAMVYHALYNAPNGETFLFFSEYFGKTIKFYENFSISKFDSEGKRSRTLRITKLICTSIETFISKFFEHKNQFCLTMACATKTAHARGDNILNTLTKCFSKTLDFF